MGGHLAPFLKIQGHIDNSHNHTCSQEVSILLSPPLIQAFYFRSKLILQPSFSRFSGRRLFSGSYSSKVNGDYSVLPNDANLIQKYLISVAYQPKDSQQEDEKSAAVSPTGEDNYVMAHMRDKVLVGVADGVGGWINHGVDCSAMSRGMCENLEDCFKKDSSANVRDLLQRAYDRILSEKIVEAGSTTICFGSISQSRMMQALNLGDSWFGVFRRSKDSYKLVYSSKEQEHYFNAPLQLAVIPEYIERHARENGGRHFNDKPSSGDLYEVQLEKNDIVLFATDGVTDNIFPKDVELYFTELVRSGKLDKGTLHKVNMDMVTQVHAISMDPKFPSAFSQKLAAIAKMQNIKAEESFLGGKYDDITSLMVLVE